MSGHGTQLPTERRSASPVSVMKLHRRPWGWGRLYFRFRPREARIRVSASKPALSAGNFLPPAKPESTLRRPSEVGEMGQVAAAAQDPVSGKSLGGPEMGVRDRDQALPVQRLGSLGRIKRPFDAWRRFANGGLRRPRRQQRPALASPPIPDVLAASKAGRQRWAAKSVPPAFPTSAMRQA